MNPVLEQVNQWLIPAVTIFSIIYSCCFYYCFYYGCSCIEESDHMDIETADQIAARRQRVSRIIEMVNRNAALSSSGLAFAPPASFDIEMALPPRRLSAPPYPEVAITPKMIHEFKDVMVRGEDDEGGANKTCCPICLEVYMPEDKVVCLSKCHHLFHPACIDRWLRKNPTCPNCRSSVSGKAWCVIKKDAEIDDNDNVEGVTDENPVVVVVEDVAEQGMAENPVVVVVDAAEQV
ncbi:PREDICTED: RING-H2 finger protein ATL68-like [Tarenaya hassleriana]|uniref:RING-H2 finger protein ATL68-like n=1 Tax=Tarenaya hassleriana TaxID=28532 RepID=UPI00053CA516|nr:PREDICTED: RING-H2 finger protein ATL68-like [Tarenaya hassleriana]